MSVEQDERDRLAAEHAMKVFAATPSFGGATVPGERVGYKGKVLTCKACVLREEWAPMEEMGGRPIPGTRPESAEWGVLWGAPVEVREGGGLWAHGGGKAGRLLRVCMEGVGIDPDAVAWGGVVQCPVMADRGPTEAEMGWCRQHVDAWMGGLRAVLLVGPMAVHQWRVDMSVEATRGKVGMWERPNGTRRHVGVVRNPAAILGAPNKGELRGELIDDLKRWVRFLDSKTPTAHMGLRCVECRDRGDGEDGVGSAARNVYWIDPDGLAWCRTHAEGTKATKPGFDRWKNARAGWGRSITPTMF